MHGHPRRAAQPNENGPNPSRSTSTCAVDLAAAAASDQLADTVDYGQVAERAAVGRGRRTPPSSCSSRWPTRWPTAALDVDRRVEAVTVTLRKLEPPLPLDVADVGVRVTRHR